MQLPADKVLPAQLSVNIWSDADWAGDHADRKSTSGSLLVVNRRIVSWASKKQAVVALSTMAEFSNAAQSIHIMVALLLDIPFQRRSATAGVSSTKCHLRMLSITPMAQQTKPRKARFHYSVKHIKLLFTVVLGDDGLFADDGKPRSEKWERMHELLSQQGVNATIHSMKTRLKRTMEDYTSSERARKRASGISETEQEVMW
ncbi:TPA: hypothetical protein N0F65_007106 [Lagenidium giganteum]|uniref:Uncharacterized protein n=1 Tax=Lagenidium giganteum TaxID=4803 RepID=A0AAV2YNN8_9STRA|nr:TPA: hypothetical protein N0F65_007106 [Lagenidium giganteum]